MVLVFFFVFFVVVVVVVDGLVVGWVSCFGLLLWCVVCGFLWISYDCVTFFFWCCLCCCFLRLKLGGGVVEGKCEEKGIEFRRCVWALAFPLYLFVELAANLPCFDFVETCHPSFGHTNP